METLTTGLAVASLLFILAIYLMEREGTMKESELTSKVTSFCQSMNAFVFKVHGHKMQRAGVPDLFIAHNKLPNCGVWLELKVGDNQLSAIQRYVMKNELHPRGQFAVVLRYKDGQYIVENVDGEALFNAPNLAVLWQGLIV